MLGLTEYSFKAITVSYFTPITKADTMMFKKLLRLLVSKNTGLISIERRITKAPTLVQE